MRIKITPEIIEQRLVGRNLILIEYQGHQHYMPVRFNSISQERAEENFIKQKLRDQQVRDYCTQHNIKLIEIPYYLSHDEQYKLIENLFLYIQQQGMELR